MRGGVSEGGGRGTYGGSVQVKTWEKPQERTSASDSSRVGVGGLVLRGGIVV